MTDVLALILGGGQGKRLFPLTQMRSKPAVPIGGKYRLIDIPISNCLHADIRRIFVLTQFNSASLNRHVAQSYRMDLFSGGFVEILAAEQTPDNPHWFQGTADAVRQASRHFTQYDAAYYLILAGDHLYRMDFNALRTTHIDHGADITIAAQPASARDATGMGIFRFDREGRLLAFEEKPNAARLAEMGSSVPPGSTFATTSAAKPFLASMGIYFFSRNVLLEALEREPGVDFGHQIIPAALVSHKVTPFVFGDYWADVGTIASFYEANISLTQRGAPFKFYDPQRPFFTHPRFLPGSVCNDCAIDQAVISGGCYLDRCTIRQSIVGIRTNIQTGSVVTRSVLLGADFFESEPAADGVPRLGVGRNAVLDRVIVDKNARIGDGVRLLNEQHVDEADGDGFYIRNGIIVVPKGGVVKTGAVV
ncbi:MAG: glucose-1-phosphate adenylyltransferase [Acidobacteria bacterium]|nr:glucose-1-phosphate adenylyltransferase [Acidobacteriota bacterium]